MSLEDLVGDKYIDSLVASNPVGATDAKSQGDDHLRGIKNVLLKTFPALTGPVTATHGELNTLDGITATVSELNVLDGITRTTGELNNADSFPSGTKLIFNQAAAPAGWTQDTALNDYMLRVVSGAGGGSGGSDSPILNNKIPTHNHAASSAANGGHNHRLGAWGRNSGNFKYSPFADGSGYAFGNNTGARYDGYTATQADHTHTITVSNNSGSNWTPKYTNTIICTKD